MPARLSAFVVWGLVAVSIAAWGLKLIVRPARAPAQAVAVADSAALRGDVSRVLGMAPTVAAPVAPGAETRFRLSGVVAPRSPSQGGVALLAVDGKMPRAIRVGARVDEQWVLQSVDRRSASIGPADGPAAVVLRLPTSPAAATGTLPPAATEAVLPPLAVVPGAVPPAMPRPLGPLGQPEMVRPPAER